MRKNITNDLLNDYENLHDHFVQCDLVTDIDDLEGMKDLVFDDLLLEHRNDIMEKGQ